MKRILAGINDSAAARAAGAWAADLALLVGAELLFVTALGPADPGPAPGGALMPEGPSARQIVIRGDPRAVLSQAGVDEDADLLVLGSTGTEWFPAVHLGHVGHHIACHTSRPLVIVPLAAASGPIGRVVLGIDGSAGSAAAVDWVAALPRELTRDVVAVHATSAPLPAIAARLPASAPGSRPGLDAWIQPLAAAGIEPTVRSVTEDAAVALCRIAQQSPGTIVVLGGRPAGERRTVGIGSIGLRVLDRACGPVLIVPPPGA